MQISVLWFIQAAYFALFHLAAANAPLITRKWRKENTQNAIECTFVCMNGVGAIVDEAFKSTFTR